MSDPVAFQTERSQVALQPKEGVLGEGGEPVGGEGEAGDARPVEGVRVQLGDVVALQVEGAQARDLVDASWHVGEATVLDADAGQRLLQSTEGCLVDILQSCSYNSQLRHRDVCEEPARQVGQGRRQGGEGEGVKVVLDAAEQAGNLLQ